MTESKDRLFIKVTATAITVALLWLGIAVTDYVMVIGLYREPIFCISADAGEGGGTFNGLCYSYEIKGNFGRSPDSETDPYGVHFARLDVLGFEAKMLYRGVHE